MPGERVTVDFRLLAPSPLAIGPHGLPVDADGLPVIRGGTIKGAVRHLATQLAASLGDPPCRGDGSPTCRICRLFGAPGSEAGLRWSDAPMVRQGLAAGGPARSLDPLTSVVSRQPLDRARRTANGQAAIHREVTTAGLAFAGRVEGWLASEQEQEEERRQSIALLLAALQRLRYVGGRQGAGCGRVDVVVTAIAIGDAPYTVGELVSALTPVGAAS